MCMLWGFLLSRSTTFSLSRLLCRLVKLERRVYGSPVHEAALGSKIRHYTAIFGLAGYTLSSVFPFIYGFTLFNLVSKIQILKPLTLFKF